MPHNYLQELFCGKEIARLCLVLKFEQQWGAQLFIWVCNGNFISKHVVITNQLLPSNAAIAAGEQSLHVNSPLCPHLLDIGRQYFRAANAIGVCCIASSFSPLPRLPGFRQSCWRRASEFRISPTPVALHWFLHLEYTSVEMWAIKQISWKFRETTKDEPA